MEQRRRELVAASAALGLPVIAAAVHGLPWIPSWRRVADGVAVVLVIVAIGGAILHAREALRRRRRAHATSEQHSDEAVPSVWWSLVVLGVCLGVSFVSLFDPFAPRFVRELAAPGTVAYVYDVSFLDAAVAVTLRRGRWPFEQRLVAVEACTPSEVRLEGVTLEVCSRRCYTVDAHCP